MQSGTKVPMRCLEFFEVLGSNRKVSRQPRNSSRRGGFVRGTLCRIRWLVGELEGARRTFQVVRSILVNYPGFDQADNELRA